MEIVALFCDIDDFCLQFEPRWQQGLIASGERQRVREGRLRLSEVMTIVISSHQSRHGSHCLYVPREKTILASTDSSGDSTRCSRSLARSNSRQ